MNKELESAVERLRFAERQNRPARLWPSEAKALLDEREVLRDACRHGLGYIVDLASECECANGYSGIQVTCPQCKLRAALAKTRNEET